MPAIVWDEVGSRIFETGLDRGVLYLADGSAVAWNGLTSVEEASDKEVNAVYFDGMKISDLVTVGDFSGTLRAFTYPDQFVELEGLGEVRSGVFYSDQPPIPFDLSYRTRIGNDVEGAEAGYKIHILYNLIAIPSQKTYATVSNELTPSEFEWSISAVPQEVPGFRPTAHIVIDTRDIDPLLLTELETLLYGSTYSVAALPTMDEIVAYLNGWYRVQITDNGDGTWTATDKSGDYISLDAIDPTKFEISLANAVYLNDETYVISDTTSEDDVPQISVEHLPGGDDYYVISTEEDELIVDLGDGTFKLLNANVSSQDTNYWEISDTTPES